jgi:hypothetical protein
MKTLKITIERLYQRNNGTMGYLFVDDVVICYSLEKPWIENINNISCIPKGTYQGFIRYDKNDKWRIQLEGVPNRSGIQIHVGNWTSQINGCILVGMEADVNNFSVYSSQLAYRNLKNAFYGSAAPTFCPAVKIEIKIKGGIG